VEAVARGRVLNVGPSPAREDDHTPDAAEAAGHLRAVDPPERVDLRAPWYTVGDQRKTGSCVGWALADSVMWRQFVEANRLPQDQRLSPRFMWMAAKEMRAKLTEAKGEPAWRPSTFLEQGMTDVKSALDVARIYGAALERELPFDDGLYPGAIEQFYDSAAQRKITHYYRLDPDDDRAGWFLHWRRWIDQHGPVLVVLTVDQAFVDVAGPHLLDNYDPGSATFNHAAALVGYGPTGFLIRCSWGDGWGQHGYAVATESYLGHATLESYGVVV
jgi:hypothetical protein